MNITIYADDINGEQIQTVNARDLHEFLEVGKDFSSWVKDRIGQYGFEENADFVLIAETGKNIAPQNGGAIRGGHNRKDYHISIDMAKELSMVERNEKGKQARQYFIECERKAKQAPADQVSALTRTDLAMMIIASEEEKAALTAINQEQACQITNMKPKAEQYDSFISSDGVINLKMAMREIGAMPNKGIKHLKDAGHFFQEGKNANTPKGTLTARGYFTVKPSKSTRDGKVYPQTMVTPRGVAWLDSVIPSELRLGVTQ